MKQADFGCFGVPRGLLKALRVLTSPTSEHHGLPSISPESAPGRRVHPSRSVPCSAHPAWLLRLCVWVKIHLVWRFRPKVAVTKSAQTCLDSNNQDPRAQKDRGAAAAHLCPLNETWLTSPSRPRSPRIPSTLTAPASAAGYGGADLRAPPARKAPKSGKRAERSQGPHPTPPAHLPGAAGLHPSRPPSPALLPEERARRPRDWNWIGLLGRGEPSLAPPGFVRSPAWSPGSSARALRPRLSQQS